MSSLIRAYSLLAHTKTSGVTGRRFSGIATTPETDRVGDVIEPMGVKVAAEVPLLLFHDHRQPVGAARFGQPTSAGIPFDATIPDITEPGVTKDLCDHAAQMVASGLLKAVSIGFRTFADKMERLANGGFRFLEIEILELSLVAVPANAAATISNVKNICRGLAPVLLSAPPPTASTLIARAWEPSKDLSLEWQLAHRRMYRRTGIAPKNYRDEERTMIALDIAKDSPGELTDDDIAYIGFIFTDDAIKAFEAREEARAVEAQPAPSVVPSHDELFVTRAMHTASIASLTARVAALERLVARESRGRHE
jgi:uncharacterized protein